MRLREARSTENAYRYTSRRRVQFHELDTVQHVNHAVYLQWIEQAYLDALHRLGHPPGQRLPDGETILRGGHEIQYFAAAIDNENIEIVSWLCETAPSGAAWTHEIYNADSRKLLAAQLRALALRQRASRTDASPSTFPRSSSSRAEVNLRVCSQWVVFGRRLVSRWPGFVRPFLAGPALRLLRPVHSGRLRPRLPLREVRRGEGRGRAVRVRPAD